MRPGSPTEIKLTAPTLADSDSAANSLFRKILPISPFDPRFCGDEDRYPSGNYNRIKILRKEEKKSEVKKIWGQPPAAVRCAKRSDGRPRSLHRPC
jgi:hypothetical protein